MRPRYGSFVSAPSSSVLRFLRSQSQDICFFTPNSRSTFCHHSHRPTNKISHSHDADRYRSIVRSFTTSQHRQATVEASLFNLEFLKQSPIQSYAPAPVEYHTLLKSLRRAPDLEPDDQPSTPSFLNEANCSILGRNKVGKSSNAHILRCAELDENGKVTDVNMQWKKSELIAKVCVCAVAAEKQSRPLNLQFLSMAFFLETCEKSIHHSCPISSCAHRQSLSISFIYGCSSSTTGCLSSTLTASPTPICSPCSCMTLRGN